MFIKEKLKDLRKQHGFTQQELAVEIGSTDKHISKWERGIVEPSVFNCVLLADVFNVSLDELCCREFKGGK